MRGNHSNVRNFGRTDIAPHGRSIHELSYRKLVTCDFGELIPVLCEEVVPGDFFKIGCQSLVRFTPTVAPFMHEINQYIHYFFVPYRLLWPKPDYAETGLEEGNWEDFITGGVQGDNDDTIPVWAPSTQATFTGTKFSLWDYFGFPINIAVPYNSLPMAFPKRAYNLIFNEYYRDETLINEVDLDSNTIQYRCWEKDYFTSALPWQQRGTAPALPVTITGSAVWPNSSFALGEPTSGGAAVKWETVNATDPRAWIQNSGGGPVNAQNFFNSNQIDADAVTFDVSDLRLAFQLQKFMERNARNGARYTEFLHSHFGASPRDDRLQRPEFIGGIKNPIIVSEVLQTSSTDATTPQGNMAGHAIGVDQGYGGKYHVQEFGVIIGIMSVMPRSMYTQGIDRQWSRKTRYDFYFPEFANLSEQGIENAELFVGTDDATNHQLFGYQGRYDEMRYKRSFITSDFRDVFHYWHLSRTFSSLPNLNQQFIQMSAAENANLKRIFADQTDKGLLISIGNLIIANRPMPIMPVPGLIDH